MKQLRRGRPTQEREPFNGAHMKLRRIGLDIAYGALAASLAREMGVDYIAGSVIEKWEGGENRPPKEAVAPLAKLLKTTQKALTTPTQQ